MKRPLLCIIAVVGAFVITTPRAHADALGQQQSFFVDTSYDHAGATSIPATLRAASQHAYFYVDDRYWASLSLDQQQQFSTALNGLIAQFDSVIYPRETQFWGNENTPGIDHDSHVFILLEWLNGGDGGYFRTINNYTVDAAPQSNAHEMIYVDAASVLDTTAKFFMAHEFQHLISFNQKELRLGVGDEVWLNEGRSEYSETVVGYNDPFNGSILQGRAREFLQTPSDPLTEWPNASADYGIASVFMQYLSDQYGPPTIAATIHTTTSGAASVNDALSAKGFSDRFGDAFVDWMVAVFLNDRNQNPRYGYITVGLQSLHVPPMARVQLGTTQDHSDIATTLKEWQPLWVEADVSIGAALSDSVAVRIAGPANTWWRGAVLAEYADNTYSVTLIPEANGTTMTTVPAHSNGAAIRALVPMITQTSDLPADGRTLVAEPVVITVSLGALPTILPLPTPTPAPYTPADGDLIRRIGQPETYVIWGPYRRYLLPSTLLLYGFQDRIVHDVSDDVFFHYLSSNYIRAIDQQKVYAIWPDNTKHWLDITPAQWDASHRDWGAIFIVNDAEVASYQTGPNITQ